MIFKIVSNNNRFPHSSSRGQATIELMLILSGIIIILGLSVGIGIDHQNTLNGIQFQYGTKETAESVAMAINQASLSPVGTMMRIFIPPHSGTQSIDIANGLVTVQNEQYIAISPTYEQLTTATGLTDGGFIQITRTDDAIQVVGGA